VPQTPFEAFSEFRDGPRLVTLGNKVGRKLKIHLSTDQSETEASRGFLDTRIAAEIEEHHGFILEAEENRNETLAKLEKDHNQSTKRRPFIEPFLFSVMTEGD